MKKHKKALPLPEGFSENDIKIESSTCTGEKTIGFYSFAENKLICAELVRNENDIIAFYERYGLKFRGEQSDGSGI